MLLSSVSRSTVFKTILLFGLESKHFVGTRLIDLRRKEGTLPTLRHQKEKKKRSQTEILLLGLLQPNDQQSEDAAVRLQLCWTCCCSLSAASSSATFGGGGQCRASCLLPHSRRYRPPITSTDPSTLHAQRAPEEQSRAGDFTFDQVDWIQTFSDGMVWYRECPYVPSEVELLMQDGEVDDGDDDLHHRYEGGDKHGSPLLDAPCHQHEGDAAADDALRK